MKTNFAFFKSSIPAIFALRLIFTIISLVAFFVVAAWLSKAANGNFIFFSHSKQIEKFIVYLIIAVAFGGFAAFATGLIFYKNILSIVRDILSLVSIENKTSNRKTASDSLLLSDNGQDKLRLLLKNLRKIVKTKLVSGKIRIDEILEKDIRQTASIGEVAKVFFKPLENLISKSENLLAGNYGAMNEKQMEDLQIVRKAGKRLMELLEDINNISVLFSENAKSTNGKNEDVDLFEIAAEVVSTARGQVGNRNIKIRVKKEENHNFIIKAKRRKIWQIVTNLVGNSVKFTTEGEVVAALKKGPDMENILEISDTGSGMSEEALDNIYDPFSQYGELSGKRHGTGLGLPITKKLVEMFGGKITVKSKVGKGSIFKVIFKNN